MARLKYKTKLSITIVCIAVIPITLIAVIYLFWSFRQTEEAMREDYRNALNSGIEFLADVRRINQEKMSTFERDSRLQSYLKRPDDFMLSDKVDLFFSLTIIYQALTLDSPIDSMRIYSVSAKNATPSFIFPYSELEEEIRIYAESVARIPDSMVIRYYGSEKERETGRGSLCCYRFKYGLDGKLSYVTRSTFSLTRLFEQKDMLPDGCVAAYLIDGQAPVILLGSSGDTGLFSDGANTASYVTFSSGVGYSAAPYDGANERRVEDTLVLLVPRSVFSEGIMQFLFIYIVALILFIALVTLVVSVTSRHLTSRLYRLMHDINIDIDCLENDSLLLDGDDEFGQINEKFISLAKKMKEYYNQSISYEFDKHVLENELLQDLISPHFLYNTLDGLKWSTRDKRVIEAIDSMVKYYRIMLNKGSKKITIAREFEMVEQYLNIQRFAYDSEFRFELYYDEELAEHLIPKLLIQPVIENAVIHGIDKREKLGFISVSARRVGQAIEFLIADNGMGMSEDKLSSFENGEGYGLSNVKKRIALYYGEEYGLTVSSVKDGGTKVKIVISYETPENS